MKSNEGILICRDRMIQMYKMYDKVFRAMAKFIGTLYILLEMNSIMGYSSVFGKSYVIAALACVCAILPAQFIIPVVMIVVGANILSFNLYMGIGSLVIFLCMYIFFIRLYPRESLLIIIVLMGFKFNLHYVITIIAALFGGFPSIIAILMGVLGGFSIGRIEPIVQAALQGQDSLTLFTKSLDLFMEQVIHNPTILATMSVLLIVFCIVYVIRIQKIDYAPYIAIVIGGAMNILGFIMAILFLDVSVNVLLLITMSIISIGLASVIQFMAKTLDYSRSENVQFEDDDNYYYVKVVPKIKTKKDYSKVEKVYTGNKQNEFFEIEE